MNGHLLSALLKCFRLFLLPFIACCHFVNCPVFSPATNQRMKQVADGLTAYGNVKIFMDGEQVRGAIKHLL